MVFSFGDFATDLRESRYVQFWFILWIFGVVLVISGLIVFAIQARQNRKDLTLRLHVEHVPSMPFPNFRFEVLNASNAEFGSIKCSAGYKSFEMAGCSADTWKQCMQTKNADSYDASFSRNNLQCSFELKSDLPPERLNETNFVVAFSIVGNTDAKDKLYVQPADQVEIFLEKIIEEELSSPKLTKYVLTPIYLSSHQTKLGQSNLTIAYNSFDVKHWVEYDSYSSWNALADLGGVLFFVWLVHSFLMIIVELLFSRSDSRVFTTPTYSNV